MTQSDKDLIIALQKDALWAFDEAVGSLTVHSEDGSVKLSRVDGDTRIDNS